MNNTNDNRDSFCVNPYLNLSIHPSGVVKPCCMSDKGYITDNGHRTLDKDSILNFWNSADRKQMIEDLNSGKRINECRACWKEEAAGKDSKRIRDNKTYQGKILDVDMLPVVLDLSMGNLCNIKCRICSPVHSTPWVIEESKIIGDSSYYFKNEKWKSFKDSFVEENSFVWDDIEKLLPNAERLDFAGGEPFYIDKHWNIVELCVKNGWSKRQLIHYNTNGTIYPEKYIHLLDQFKIVDIQISSDGVEEKFEYLRHPAKWQTSEMVVDKLCEVRNNSDTEWLIGACLSVSAFNVYDIFETFEHYAAKDDVRIYINIVHDHRGTRTLPNELKSIIIGKLKNTRSKYKFSQWEKEKIMICNHLENSTFNDHDWKNFWKELKMRDTLRNESFENTFPEYYQYMKGFVE
jgi:MoaA/NifB/PqqE/SkfB family radical SAM enzyme